MILAGAAGCRQGLDAGREDQQRNVIDRGHSAGDQQPSAATAGTAGCRCDLDDISIGDQPAGAVDRRTGCCMIIKS